ncbi:MAG: hypothetical protein ACRC1K_22385 [Planctomycetia bacterium]
MAEALRRSAEASKAAGAVFVSLPPRRPAGYVAKTEAPVDEAPTK